MITLDGTEQVLHATDYQFAGGTKIISTGYVMATGRPSPPVITSPVTIRLRLDTATGTVVDSCTAVLVGADAVRFAFSAVRSTIAHRLVLTVQAASATGAEVFGNLDVEVTP